MDILTALDAKMMKMYLRDFARINNDNNFSDGYGNSVSLQMPRYTWGYQPQPWEAPWASDILINPDCLTGYGANTQGIRMRTNSLNWQPADRGQILYGVSGSIATPLVTGVAGIGTGDNKDVSLLGSLAQPMIPAYMLYKGCRGRVQCWIRKTNANAAFEVVVRLGNTPLPDITTNKALLDLSAINTADKRDFWASAEFVITAAGPAGTANLITTNWLASNGSGTAVINDALPAATSITTIDPMYLNINIIGNASDTFGLIGYSWEILPQ